MTKLSFPTSASLRRGGFSSFFSPEDSNLHDYSASQVNKQTLQSFPLTKTLNLTFPKTPWIFNGRVLLPKETRNKLPYNCGFLLDFTDGEEKEEHGTIARLKIACALSLSLH